VANLDAAIDDVHEMLSPIDLAKKQLEVYQRGISDMQAEAEAIAVRTSDDERRCAEMAAQAKTLLKKIEATQAEIVAEPQRFVRSVQTFTLPLRRQLDGIVNVLKAKIGQYAYIKEQGRRKAEEEARKASVALQKKLDKEAKRAGIEPVQMPQMVIPVEKGPVRTESGTSSIRFVWTYDVVDKGKVPADYLKDDPTDSKKVNAAITSGIREIPGLKIFEIPTVRTSAGGY